MKVTVAAGVAALLLLGWMVILFVQHPTIEYDTPDTNGTARAECGSVAAAGWPWNRGVLLDEHGYGLQTDGVIGEDLSRLTLSGIYRDCDQRRTTYAGAMALLAVPASLLGVFAVVRWRGTRAAALEHPDRVTG